MKLAKGVAFEGFASTVFFKNRSMPIFRTKPLTSKGFYWVKRPLLDLTRSEVTFLTTIEALPVSADSTNRLGGSSRAQIRHLLVPLIRQLGFASVEDHISVFGTSKWVDRDSNPELFG